MIKKFDNIKDEFDYLTPNTFFNKSHDSEKDGKLNIKKLPWLLQPSMLDKCIDFVLFKHPYLFFLVSICLALIIAFSNVIISILYALLIICCIIGLKQAKCTFVFKNKAIEGVNAYNNMNFEEALALFQQAQSIYPVIADYLNDWIYLCLLRLNRDTEAYNFLTTHNVTSKRFRIYFMYIAQNKYDEALQYFENNFSVDELKEHPFAYGLQIDTYLKFNKPNEAIEYIHSKGVNNWFMTEEKFFVLFNLAKCYIQIKDYDKAQALYKTILTYMPDNEKVLRAQKELKEKIVNDNIKP